MPFAAKFNDKGIQHDGCCKTVIIAGSSTVFIDGFHGIDPSAPAGSNASLGWGVRIFDGK